MAPIRSYRDLEAWKRAMELAEGCYRFTDTFPKSEVFGLAAHIRKSAVSIPSNIAEGHVGARGCVCELRRNRHG